MPVSRKKFLILSLSLSPLCCLYFAIVVFLLKVELFFTCKVHHIHIHHYHHPPPYYHHCTTSCRFKMNAFVDFSLPTTTIFEISQLCFVWLGFFYDFQNSISSRKKGGTGVVAAETAIINESRVDRCNNDIGKRSTIDARHN